LARGVKGGEAFWACAVGSCTSPNIARTSLRTDSVGVTGELTHDEDLSRGMSERRLIGRHVLRNSIVPVVTLLGASIPYALSGTIIIEAVFNFPGMGLLFWNAAQTRDFAVLIGCTLVVATGAVIGSLVVDLLYMVLDPRVRTG
jgi:ABC-type microcin C transport system permease subunit YejB